MNCLSNNNGRNAPGTGQRRAFTLMEVMIATGILFMCLFAVLALTSNALVTARKLQQHKPIDAGTVASVIYVELINTNRLDEGPIDVDWEDILPPGYKGDAEITSIGTNGLGQVDFLVQHNQELILQSHFWIYQPNLKQGGISSSLPSH